MGKGNGYADIVYFLSFSVQSLNQVNFTCQMRCGMWKMVIIQCGQPPYMFLHFKLKSILYAFFIKGS